jgi:hypothetical protein
MVNRASFGATPAPRSTTTTRHMSSPQDPRARRRERRRRARKNIAWEARRADENQKAAEPKASAKKAT